MAGPYELQSPKDIAMEYGGNKKKIAQATQMGIIDPTAAVLAGMFIDKMRMAQAEETANNLSVAQETFPQMAGLGATPQAAMAPAEAGVAALPVPDDMVPDEYAGGGIVAFSNGGKLSKEEIEKRLLEASKGRGSDVSRPRSINRNPQGLDFIDTETDIVETYPSKNLRRPVSSSYTGPAKPPITSFSASKEPVFLYTTQPTEDPRIAEVMKNLELRRRILGEDVALKTEREGMKAAMDEQRAMRLIEAGLGIMGGTSQYALQNIGKGAMPAIRGYGEDVAAQRKRAAELAGAERAEKAKVLESAIGDTQAREKLTPENIRTAREIQAEAKAAGKPVPTLAQALKSIERTQTATLQAAYVSSQRDAAKAVGELVNSQLFKQELKSIEKKQGKEAAEAYKRQRIRETVGLFPGVDPDQVMSVVGGGGAAPAKPTLSQFLEKARKVNPGVSDGELTKYYNEKYGK